MKDIADQETIKLLKSENDRLKLENEQLREACKYDALNASAIAEIRRVCNEIMGGNTTFVDDDFARCLLTLNDEVKRLKERILVDE